MKAYLSLVFSTKNPFWLGHPCSADFSLWSNQSFSSALFNFFDRKSSNAILLVCQLPRLVVLLWFLSVSRLFPRRKVWKWCRTIFWLLKWVERIGIDFVIGQLQAPTERDFETISYFVRHDSWSCFWEKFWKIFVKILLRNPLCA